MGVVLIAFERESEQSAIEQLLTSRGHQVQKSANGLAALDSARREPPDAVVSDIVLPRMDGFALCRKWKQDERLQHIPFIFYTRRHDDPKYERFALELGAERFLSRSVAPDALATAVDELLANAPGKAAPPAAPQQPAVMMATGAYRAAAPQPAVMMATGAHRAAAPQPAVMMATGAHRAAAPQQPAVMMATGAHRAAAPQPAAVMMATGAHPAAAPQPAAVMMATGAHPARAITEANQKHLEALERAQLVQARLRAQVNDLETMNERLSASETRFRKIFEANPLPMWIADHETGGFIAVNEASLAFYGYSRAELLAMKSNALVIEAQAASSNIARHKRKNGEVATVALGTQEIDFDGRRADLVTAFDLTERASREADLQQQLTASRAIFASIADGVLILDAAGRVVDANPAYCRLSGYAREELLKLKAADIEDQSSGEHTLKFHMGRTSGSGRYESKHRRQDGTFLDMEVVVGPSSVAGGDTMLVVRDVSQRRRELMAHKAQQRQLEFLVELFKQSESFDESA